MIGRARMIKGLYYFDDISVGNKKAQGFSSTSSIPVQETIMLWHLRLGHPNFAYLKRLFPKLFKGMDYSSFQCESCILAKNHRSTYLPKPLSSVQTFLYNS